MTRRLVRAKANAFRFISSTPSRSSYIVRSGAFPFPCELEGGDEALKIFDDCGVESGVKLWNGFEFEVVGVAINSGLRISWLLLENEVRDSNVCRRWPGSALGGWSWTAGVEGNDTG